jgi:hypothetical protein
MTPISRPKPAKATEAARAARLAANDAGNHWFGGLVAVFYAGLLPVKLNFTPRPNGL